MTSTTTTPLRPAQLQRLLNLLEQGLPHCARPYQALAQQIGASETTVIEQVRTWQQKGLFRRFGLVIHHRKLGISANLMLVLDIPERDVLQVGRTLAREPAVTLCYQRRPQPPHWPYNLFCMIHGRNRTDVLSQANQMLSRLGLDTAPRQMLFSVRAFKQRGARYHPPSTDVAMSPTSDRSTHGHI